MILWLLRHAKAVADPPAGGTDHDRPLTPRGRRDAEALGRRLADPGFGPEGRPELVLCSTATRTVQTAAGVLAALDRPPPVEYRRALYGAAAGEILDELEDGVGSVLVVGHNPGMHDLAAALDGDAPFPTCALAVYRMSPGEGSTLLGRFAPPY